MPTTQPLRRPGAVQPAGRDRRERLAAVVGALVVLVLWGVWLLLPPGEDPGQTASPPPSLPPSSPPAVIPGEDDPAADPAEAVAQGGPGAAREPAATTQQQRRDLPEPQRAADAEGEVEEPTGPVQVEPSQAASAVAVPQAGAGTFTTAPGSSEPAGEGRLVTYTVEVEDGVPVDPAEAAAVVDAVLADPRSWRAEGRWSLQRVPADGDARIVVTSPDTTDRLCAPLRTRGQVSCRNGENVVLNALRWTRGASTWGEDVDGYRQYLVNHEVGHLLGFGHVPCPAAGQPAPVMLQQTIRLDGCEANAWPFP